MGSSPAPQRPDLDARFPPSPPASKEETPQPQARALPMPVAVALLVCALAVSVLLAIGLGAAAVSPGETLRYLWAALTGGRITAEEVSSYQIIWQVRTPRVLLAAVVGAGLSAVGVAIQAMVRNALADPFVLGVSSGVPVVIAENPTDGPLTCSDVRAPEGWCAGW
ncbi:iron chelate uptake ABC transporter family permease subunit [Streptosporangium canum]|uniref:iron chelate uptake ABC transporter family permease subunit n=1 Tax=Streptosporangium canum TaxID=324952 RepID=UPI003F4B4D26